MQSLNQSQHLQTCQENNSNTISQTNKQKNFKITQKCIDNNIISHFCVHMNQIKKYIFFCHDNKCKCNKNHENCIKSKLDPIIDKINQQILKNKNQFMVFKKQISQLFTNLIKQINEDEKRILQNVENHCNLVYLMGLQNKNYKLLVEQNLQNIQEFEKQKLSNLLQIIERNHVEDKQKEQQQFKRCIKLLNKLENKCLESIQNTKKMYQRTINIIKQQIITDRMTKSYMQFKGQLYPNQFFPQSSPSKIILNRPQLNILINFFDKKIKRINVVFKASQNDFEIKKYYQNCGHLQNTIILCKTQKDKIIGGYTPLTFNPVNLNKDVFFQDQTGASFLFSLTNNNKFQLKQKQKAIRRSSNKQWIGFGNGCTFVIQNKAHQNANSFFYLKSKTYLNQNYNENQQSYKKLTGNRNLYFGVKQWEILQVQFFDI